ncbi:MFS transporter [Trebonia kvetii]|uniref:MFS transporter n=1 Tax=Trebonia kvetii TaxID=2480626 RepID=UPI0016529BFF|nr:MFS transporter [Trebonia kvetii]
MTRLRPPRALAPLRHRDFRLLVAGQVTSNVGDACYAVALPWFVLAGHGGTVLLGTVLAAYGIPRTALIMAGGWASDRWRPQTVMLVSDALRVVAMAALAVTAAGPARAALLIPVAVVLGAGEGLFLPASFSVVPSLLPGNDLQAGNALASGGTQLASLAGPALGGALVAMGSPSAAFWLDAVSFAVSAATLLAMYPARSGTARSGSARSGATRSGDAQKVPAAVPDAASGTAGPSLRTLLRTERVLPVLIAINIAANLGSAGLNGVALPSLAHGPLHASAQGYGAILAGFAAGALLGTLAAGQAGRPRRPVVTGSAAFLIEAVAIAATPFLGVVGWVIAAQAVFGLCNGFGNTYTVTAFQRWAPAGSLGRLNGLLLLTSFGMAPVSVLLAAWFGHALGPASFFLFAAVTIAAAVIGGLTQRAWRDFGAAPRVRPEPARQSAPARHGAPAGPAAMNAGGEIAAT